MQNQDFSKLLGDIIERLVPNRKFENHYNELKIIINKIVSNTPDFESLITLVSSWSKWITVDIMFRICKLSDKTDIFFSILWTFCYINVPFSKSTHTIPWIAKKIIFIALNFDLLTRAFLAFGEVRPFHCMDWCFVSGSWKLKKQDSLYVMTLSLNFGHL